MDVSRSFCNMAEQALANTIILGPSNVDPVLVGVRKWVWPH